MTADRSGAQRREGENPTRGLTLLDADHEVVVTREEHHQASIARWAPAAGGEARRVATELVPATIGHGTHAGEPGLEVRIDGRRIGELTHLMARRYGPLVLAHLRRGERPAAVGLVHRTARGMEVGLLLPEPAALDGLVSAMSLPPAGWPVPQPRSAPDGSGVASLPPGGSGATPLPGPGGGGARRRRRRTPWLVGAGVALLLLLVAAGLAGGRTGDAAPVVAAGTNTPATAPGSPASPATPSAAPTAAATVAPAATGPAPGPGVGTAAVQQANPAPAVAPARVTKSPRPAAAATPAPKPAAAKPPPPAAPAPAPVGGRCDPNYTPCVPVATDVDCKGGSGNGPAYVQGPIRVTGKDVYGLDADGDGIGCE